MNKKVIVVGGGVAGMQTAITLCDMGVTPVIVEKDDKLGGKLNNWHKLFPSLTPANQIVDRLKELIAELGVEIRNNTEVEHVTSEGVMLVGGEKIDADAIVVCTGFELFDAKLKEEYGYGIYNNVITSTDLERMFNEGTVTTTQGVAPRRIALLHCVGSRDEKVGQRHCSRVCCITGVKQAMELKEMFPDSEVFNFYMDIRMFGAGYEELYRQAQIENNIHFVRGRISEASQTIDGHIQIKAEDTLVGKPLKMTVDMLVLLVGMCAGKSNASFAEDGKIDMYNSGFLKPINQFIGNNNSPIDNVFYAGTVSAPKNVGESLSEGIAAAYKVVNYLKR